MINTTESLIEVNKKMERIEEKDCDFRNNAKWRELKSQQDELFLQLAKEKLSFLESKNKDLMSERDEKLINFYKGYIKSEENPDVYRL